MKKIVMVFFVVLIFIFNTSAYESSTYDIENDIGLSELEKFIPNEIREYIPDGIFSDMKNTNDVVDKVGTNFLLSTISKILLKLINPILKNFSMMLGLIIIASIFAVLKNSISSSAISTVFEYVSALCIALSLYNILNELFMSVRIFMEQLNVFMNSMLPIMTALYSAGGNITTAVVSNAGMMFMLTVMQNICYYGLFPILQICFGMSLISSVSNSTNLSGISSFIKNTFTFIIIFIMTILTTVLAYQTTLTVGADTFAVRTIKFAAGSFIPIVGGAVSEAVRTVMGSLSLIKSTVGVIGIIIIIISALPPFLSILLNKISINFIAVIAKVLGCDRESSFLSEMNGLLNFSIAIMSSTALLFIFSLTLFIKSSVALGI